MQPDTPAADNKKGDATDTLNPDAAPRVSPFVVFTTFLRFGFTAFGGPVAHLAYFRRELVERLGWLSRADYAGLVGLCQVTPGPTSSKTGFIIGLRVAGLAGGVAAFVGFTLPSTVLMLTAAFAIDRLAGGGTSAVIHGLQLVAVAVVAKALLGMARDHCTTPFRVALAACVLAIMLLSGFTLAAPVIIVAAMLAGAVFGPSGGSAQPVPKPSRVAPRSQRLLPIALLVAFAAPLVLLPIAVHAAPNSRYLEVANAFYRSGALIIGGGQVVIPLLQAKTAAFMPTETFLAGYGAMQALPGPRFAFAAYLGALSATGGVDPVLGVIALLCLFAPGLLIISAADLGWRGLGDNPRVRGAVTYTSAAVVGVLAAAWWTPIVSSSIGSVLDVVIVAAGLAVLLHKRTPAVLAVLGVATSGAIAATLG